LLVWPWTKDLFPMLDNILHGALGTETGPTPIRDLTTQKLIRPAST